MLEWFDPPFNSGHWNPDLIRLAGGREMLGRAGVPSRQATWAEVAATEAEVVLLSPCGFALDRSATELEELFARPEFQNLPAVRADRVALIDGSAYFSRPGPRLIESLGIAAATIDPSRCGDLAPTSGWRLPAR